MALRQLSILLTLALTSIGVTLYHILRRKKCEDKKNIQECIPYKNIIIPKHCLYAVIGEDGLAIKDIQAKTSTSMRFFEDGIKRRQLEAVLRLKFPYKDIVCMIEGSKENVSLAATMIENIIETNSIIDTTSLQLSRKDIKKLYLKHSDILFRINETSLATIYCDVDIKHVIHHYGEKRMLRVEGTVGQRAKAIHLINEEIRRNGKLIDTKNEEKKEVFGHFQFSPTDIGTLCSYKRIPIERSDYVITVPDFEPLKFSDLKSSLSKDGIVEVYVSEIDTPNHFWIQIPGPGIIALNNLSAIMKSYYNNKYDPFSEFEIKVGQIVAVCNREEGKDRWYRAEVMEILENDYRVFYVDYGKSKIHHITNIFELRSDMLGLRAMAVECFLANLRKPERWTNGAYKKFIRYTHMKKQKLIIAKFRGYIMRPFVSNVPSLKNSSLVACVELYNRTKEINVGKALLKSNLALYEEDVYVTKTDAALKQLYLSSSEHVSNNEVDIAETPEQSTEETDNSSTELSKDINDSIEVNTPMKVQSWNFLLTRKAIEMSNVDIHDKEESNVIVDLRGVFVCAVETPGRFWIQYLDKSDIGYNLIGFARNIKRYYNKRKNQKRHALKEVKKDQIVVVKSSKNRMWYRAKVMKILENEQYEVYSVDYGGFEVVSADNMFEYNENSSYPHFNQDWAVECTLANVKPRNGRWSEEACRKFLELTCPKLNRVYFRYQIWAKVVGYIKNTRIYCLDLHVLEDPITSYHKTISIGETLVDLGLAQFKNEHHKTGPLDWKNQKRHISFSYPSNSKERYYEPTESLSSISESDDLDDEENSQMKVLDLPCAETINLISNSTPRKEFDQLIEEEHIIKKHMNSLEKKDTSDSSYSTSDSAIVLPSAFEKKLDDLDLIEVYVWTVKTPSQFWIQMRDFDNMFILDTNLESKITSYYNDETNHELHVLQEITEGQVVAVKVRRSNTWHRAIIIDPNSWSECKVFLIDNGEYKYILRQDILDLPTDMLNLEWQYVECSLANVKSRSDEMNWTSEAVEKFCSLVRHTSDTEIFVKIRGYKNRLVGTPILYVDVYGNEEDINVGQIMVNLNYARFEEDIDLSTDPTLLLNIKLQLLEYGSWKRDKFLKENFETESDNDNESDFKLNNLHSSPILRDNLNSEVNIEEMTDSQQPTV